MSAVANNNGLDIQSTLKQCLSRGINYTELPPPITNRSILYPHAPIRTPNLSSKDFQLAISNSLRYFPSSYHSILAPEFAAELRDYGHIYMYRFMPTEYSIKAYPLQYYPARTVIGKSIQLMIMNNLDPNVAQFPAELITYGGNGSVLSNWIQYHLLMYYLTIMTTEQSLHMYSGHPLGLFPSTVTAPRLVISNGLTIPNYSTTAEYDRMYAIGTTIYGQMTAGSFAYIGSQGIIHGTTITILNAGRKYLSINNAADMAGRVYVSSGLGGMSGAQGKAGCIAGTISVIAEIDPSALNKRLSQGWISEKCTDINQCIARIKSARTNREVTAIGYLGNIVTLWEALAAEKELLVELGSDQTSLHNPYNGGYYPVELTFTESQELMHKNPIKFKSLVNSSLIRHVNAINLLTSRGMKFWDYGNSFLLQSSRAGADIWSNNSDHSAGFKYPTYIQEFVGDVFSLGFGPFRWICTSGLESDLELTDTIAANVIKQLLNNTTEQPIIQQLKDNLLWIERAGENKMVVGSQARILYADAAGRVAIAKAFNTAVAELKLQQPIVLSRDHHDVSGTDSPFRETSNITDGSNYCADMAMNNVIGDAMRGASWVSIHNGGGCGWGEVINGGFGLVLDGTNEAADRAELMLGFDVNNGIARRAWSGNNNALLAINNNSKSQPLLNVTIPAKVDQLLIQSVCKPEIESAATATATAATAVTNTDADTDSANKRRRVSRTAKAK